MEQPEVLTSLGKEDYVCLLNKCLHGLKQAPRIWNEKFNRFLVKFGLSRSEFDSCMYFRRNSKEILIVAIFVDDTLVYLVLWSSKRQKCVSQYTTEAEYVAAPHSSKEAVWLSSLLMEIGETSKQPVPIFCDNQSAIQSIRNPSFHQRTKHIYIKYHFIRSLQENQIIDVSFVSSKEQKTVHNPIGCALILECMTTF